MAPRTRHDPAERQITYLVRDHLADKDIIVSEVLLIEDVLSLEESIRYLHLLSTEFIPWKVEVDNFGVQTQQTCYFGDPGAVFLYVGLRLVPQEGPWPACLDELRRAVLEACGLSSSPPYVLTACLANRYMEGEGYIPWHYDEVCAHGPQKVVASLSLGGPRRFQLRRRHRRDRDLDRSCQRSSNNNKEGPSTGPTKDTNQTVEQEREEENEQPEVVADIIILPS
jgi:2OG-Fe(II) oxygenase superfamily